MHFSLITLVLLLLGIFANAKNPYKEWAETIAHSKFVHSCWGDKSATKHYLMVKKVTKECMGLDPAFDIDLFPEDNNMMFAQRLGGVGAAKKAHSPLFVNQMGMATLPAQVGRLSFNYPYQPMVSNPWMQYWNNANQGSYYSRSKRAVMPPSEEDLENFAEAISDAKDMKHSLVGNLTCVLSKLGCLDANLNINLQHYTRDMWTMFESGEEPDYEFKQKMIESYEDCYQMANSLPMDILAKKGPGWKQFGRQKMFFKCAKKMTMANCVKKELVAWHDFLYGGSTPEKRRELGLPEDEYDGVFMAWEVLKHVTPKEEEFVMDFVFGK